MNPTRKSDEPNRREFLAGSMGALLAAKIGGLSAAANASALINPEITPAQSAAPHRIIIDTDPGVDDALAILLALHSPELKVEAITPVAGNVGLEFTLPNALRLVEIAGRTDVPVAAGASHPLVRTLFTASYVHGNNGLGGVDFPAPKIKPVAETATEIIRRIVRANPGEISIVAVGPLTNVGTVLRADPALASMIRSIVIMGGSLSGGNVTPAAEFNLWVDPEAARIVFDADVPLTMVGLDVTRKVLFTPEHLRILESGTTPSSQAAARIMRATIDNLSKLPHPMLEAMHDPLTIAHLIDPGILKLQDYYVEVETAGEFTAGQTLGYPWAPARGSAPMATAAGKTSTAELEYRTNAKVAIGVDPDRFFRLLLSRLMST
ncbi:MAG: nucleoside hydrolase [Candidatus Acidiferrales bacterium]